MASLAEKRVVEVVDEVAERAPAEQATEGPAARPEELRLLEALLFAASEPLDQSALAKRMPDGVDIKDALQRLQADYAMRGVNLVRIGTKWSFRTASDLSWLMTRESTETRKLSRAAIEVLAIIAYHQPVTRAEIEDIRGVVTSKGTLDVLLETGWIRPRGRRKTPGRPLTFGTTEAFLAQFSLEALSDLPGLEELKGTGLLDSRLPSGFSVPAPSDDPALREDEDPLEPGDLDLALAPAVEPEAAPESRTETQTGGEAAPVEPGDAMEGTPEPRSDVDAETDVEAEAEAEIEADTEADADVEELADAVAELGKADEAEDAEAESDVDSIVLVTEEEVLFAETDAALSEDEADAGGEEAAADESEPGAEIEATAEDEEHPDSDGEPPADTD
jgi:segregation and condensation protein B